MYAMDYHCADTYAVYLSFCGHICVHFSGVTIYIYIYNHSYTGPREDGGFKLMLRLDVGFMLVGYMKNNNVNLLIML